MSRSRIAVSFIKASIRALDLAMFNCSICRGLVIIGGWYLGLSDTPWHPWGGSHRNQRIVLSILVDNPSCHVLQHNARTFVFPCSSMLRGRDPGS